MKKFLGLGIGLVSIALGIWCAQPRYLTASDHDDGETDIKGRNLNLTDLYVFNTIDQNPSAPRDNVTLIMNTNPRSLAREPYFFSTVARYEFRIARVPGGPDTAATGNPDVILRFEFQPPDANDRQRFKVTAIRDGQTLEADGGFTTPLDGNPRCEATINAVQLGNDRLQVFAGLREDPFYFDVEQFFRVRAGLLGQGPSVGFRAPDRAVDFAAGYNVNAIVVSIPGSFLRGNTQASVYDIWQNIFFPNERGEFVSVERLARPGINELLVISNNAKATLNAIGPDFEAAALAGRQPQASAAAPIVGEVARVLGALGNDAQRTNVLLGAFLPDVMRIDTQRVSGYGLFQNRNGSPASGSRLGDDVVDVSLSVLTNGAVTTDNVSYEGTPGNPAQGHDPLCPNFPYLAVAN